MSLPGYPDYARVELEAGYLLAGANAAFLAPTQLFAGYLGSWPFINFFWNAAGGAAHHQVIVSYYRDGTFSSLIAEQIAVRDSNCTGLRQFATLSPWVVISVVPDISTDHTVVQYAFYGTVAAASPSKLGSLDTVFFEFSSSVAASTMVDVSVVKIYPGPVIFTWFTSATSFEFFIQRWDYGTATWKNIMDLNSDGAARSDLIEVALPDAPVQVVISNVNVSAQQFNVYMMPKML